jgi:tetratricopeptide (TPR) repeat protein
MTVGQWQRLEAVYQLAMDADPADRDRVVAAACAGDAELLEEVKKLLDQTADAAGFLEAPAFEQMTTSVGVMTDVAAASQTDSLLGAMAGPYRIEAEVGRGGMGTVYRAVRDDGSYMQEVALKVVKRGFDSPDLLERFRRERQILAMVSHPNIARILDGGTTSDGRPYYAMEFVAGEPLTSYCHQRKLSLDQRLCLFLDVCSAVAHAHQNLIIHRDIKPANIMVTHSGTVKLLDFGIAKIFFEDMPDVGQTIASGGPALLTPNYAAPEQVRGERVTTATDIYALGLILYELLTGKRAQQVTNSSPGELARAVCEAQPTRPEIAAATSELAIKPASALRGDLETVLLKSLQKDPARRYATVNQFAEDLERYRSGRTVTARPDSAWYRASMFVRRNKLAVVAAAVVALSLVTGFGVALWQERIAREHFAAVRSLAKSLINEINPAIMDVPGTTKARLLIVQRSVDYLDRLTASAGRDPVILQEAAEAYESVAALQGNRNKSNLGDYAGAMVSYRKALAIRDRIEQIAPSDENKRWIAMINAEASRVYPNSDEGLAMARKAVSIAASVHDYQSKYAHAYPNTLFGLSYVLTNREESEEAVKLLQHAREIFIAIKRGAAVLSLCDRYIGINYTLLGRDDDALKSYASAEAVDAPRMAKQPSPRVQMDVSYDYEGMARAYAALGRWREALPEAQKARQIRERLAAGDPNDNRTRLGLADAAETLGLVWSGLGARDKAVALLKEAVETREEIVRAAPESPEDQYELGRTYLTMGSAYRQMGQCGESAKWLAKARPIFDAQKRKLSLAALERAAKCGPAH